MVTTNFPRGGKKPLNRASSTFAFNKKTKVKPRKFRKPRVQEGSERCTSQENSQIAPQAPCLSYSTLTTGMVVLGRIHNTTTIDISVALPGRLSGFLEATDISESYTKILTSLISPEGNTKEYKPLSQMYKRGDYVVCYVKHTDSESKHRVLLSMEPEKINQNLDHTKLKKGSKIVCSVGSIEEHGYAMDTGIKSLRGFLFKTEVDDNVQYYPGQQLLCSVQSVITSENITTVRLSTKRKVVNSTSFDETIPLDALVPGTRFKLMVEKLLRDGLYVTFNDNCAGYINQLYLQNPLEAYEPGTEITGYFMYTLPVIKSSFFTEIPLIKEETILTIGDVEKATVLYREARGLVLAMKDNTKGYLPFFRTGVDFESIPEKFAPGSTHKCRIITYDNFDRVYVCTANKTEMKTTHKLPETVRAGDIMQVQIVRQNPNNGYVFVKSNRILGDVAPEHICDIGETLDIQKLIKSGAKVVARVLSRDKRGERFNFTLKNSLIDSKFPVITKLEDVKVDSVYLGTIILINPAGLLVKFYEDLKGLVPRKTMKRIPAKFQVGQVVQVRVTNVIPAEHRLCLALDHEKYEDKIPFKIGQEVEGKIVESSEKGVSLSIQDPSKKHEPFIGFLPAGHMSPCKQTGELLARHAIPGDVMSVLVFSTTPVFLLTTTLVPQEWYSDLKNLNFGDCIPCSVTQIDKTEGLKVVLPIKDLQTFGTVAVNKVDNINEVSKHQMFFGKIVNLCKKTRQLYLTTVLHDLWSSAVKSDSDVIASIDVLTLYFSKLKELSNLTYYKTKPISSMHLGQPITATVENITKHGLVLKLPNEVQAIVRKVHIHGEPKIGDEIRGTVIWVNYLTDLVEVTLNPVLMNAIKPKQTSFPENAHNVALKGEIVLVDKWFVLALVRGQGKGCLIALPTKVHLNDVTPDVSSYVIGGKVKCFVMLATSESPIVPIGVMKSSFEVLKKFNEAKVAVKPVQTYRQYNVRSKFANQEEEKEALERMMEKKNNKKKKKNQETSENNEPVDDNKKGKKRKNVEVIETKEEPEEVETISVTKSKKQKKQKNEEVELDTKPEEQDSKNSKRKREAKPEKQIDAEVNQLSLPECGFFWDTKPDESLKTQEESSDDDDEEDEPSQKKKKKLTPAERRELERQKEREIREKEEALASNQIPNSVDKFDRLVLASPDSSLIWLQYMAFHLQATEIEKARAVAKRALKTINFREEEEKLNVWRGWLNLESRFGTPETLNDVFQEATKANDSMKIYLHMLSVHSDAGRTVEVEKTVKTITGKFKSFPEIWVDCGAALLKLGLKEKSRHTMQRALQSLPPAQHVNLMVRFAQLENQFGDRERADTLYEKILTSYPKRVDVWSTYVDSLIKASDYDSARKVLERAVIQTLPAKKMKSLFKKFISFEEEHGDETSLAHVRELAAKYVENQCKT